MSHYKIKQSGTFSVEFAIIGVFFSIMLVFSGDIIIKLATKGKLERLSFSLVSILKERSALYGGEFAPKNAVAEAEAKQLQAIAENSLSRTLGGWEASNFGILVEAQTYTQATENASAKANTLQSYQKTGQVCLPIPTLDTLQSNLTVKTSWNRQASVYRVTICYLTDNWFERISGTSFNNLVQSSSVMIGR